MRFYIIHTLSLSKAKKRGSMAVKTDMSKAYDRIEWDFLRAVLSSLGFHTMWIEWIMECVSTVSYSFLVNGSPQGKVTPSRGIRQCDPLSPYLFILCTEVLSGLCRKAQEDRSLPGVRVWPNSPAVSHLLFADDIIFFWKSSKKACHALANILQNYKAVSGQCINLRQIIHQLFQENITSSQTSS